MNRYRGTQAEFQFSMVSPHTAHSKLLISRSSTICSLRSSLWTVRFPVNHPAAIKLSHPWRWVDCLA